METNIDIAKFLFKQNDYIGAINACEKILVTDINSFENIKLLAKSFLAIQKNENAFFYLNKALNIKPYDFEVIKDIGNYYQTLGDINKAKKYYQKAIEINSFYAPGLCNLGTIEITIGNK